MVTSRRNSESAKSRRPPATTPESRENQLVALAVDLAERQLAEGTASTPVITHYLKLGTTRERLEQEKIRRENLLLQARVDNLANLQNSEAMYSEALNAMRRYSGQEVSDDYEN